MNSQEFNGTYQDCSVEIADREPKTLYRLMRLNGQLASAQIQPHPMHIGAKEEEQMLATLDVKNASGYFERNRHKVAKTLGALASYVFQKHGLAKNGGVDFGSGMTGAMVHDLLAPSINASTWAEIDIHPDAVAENKRRHPGATVLRGSYLDVEALGLKGVLSVATGLSSLDATYFIDDAVRQIGSTLTPGGAFLHIQDVRPGVNSGFQALRRMNVRPPYRGEVLVSPTNNAVMGYQTPSGWSSVGELFRQNIGNAIEQDDSLELVMNDWVIARRPVGNNAPGRLYQMNICLDVPTPSQFSTLPEEFQSLLQSHVGFEQSAAVVTVARKRG